MKTYDVCLGGHIACTTTSKEAADAIKSCFDDVAADLYQHDACAIRPSNRAPAPPKKKPAKKKAARKKA